MCLVGLALIRPSCRSAEYIAELVFAMSFFVSALKIRTTGQHCDGASKCGQYVEPFKEYS